MKLVLTFPPHSLYMYAAPLVSGLQTPAYIAGRSGYNDEARSGQSAPVRTTNEGGGNSPPFFLFLSLSSSIFAVTALHGLTWETHTS